MISNKPLMKICSFVVIVLCFIICLKGCAIFFNFFQIPLHVLTNYISCKFYILFSLSHSYSIIFKREIQTTRLSVKVIPNIFLSTQVMYMSYLAEMRMHLSPSCQRTLLSRMLNRGWLIVVETLLLPVIFTWSKLP